MKALLRAYKRLQAMTQLTLGGLTEVRPFRMSMLQVPACTVLSMRLTTVQAS